MKQSKLISLSQLNRVSPYVDVKTMEGKPTRCNNKKDFDSYELKADIYYELEETHIIVEFRLYSKITQHDSKHILTNDNVMK